MLLKYTFIPLCAAGLTLTAPNLVSSTEFVAARDGMIGGKNTVTLPPIPANISAIAGPPIVGIILNWFLYGIMVMQIYVYYQWFPDDKKAIKWLVYGIFVVDTVQSVLATADAFYWFAKGFGNMLTLSDPFISAFDAPILDGIIAFTVQSFFCWRIWVLQKSWWLPSAVFLVALVTLAGAIASGIGAFQVGNLTLLGTLNFQLSLWLSGSALTDTLIAIVMTILLLQSRTGENQHSDNVLVRIVRLTVETNTVTASVAIVELVCLLAIPDNPSIAMAPSYLLGKLYSNTLLAVFNNRVYMNSRGMFPRSLSRTAVSTGASDIKFRAPQSSSSQPQMPNKELEMHAEPYRIEVFRQIEVADDVHLSPVNNLTTRTIGHVQDSNSDHTQAVSQDL